jgi:repressor LexA
MENLKKARKAKKLTQKALGDNVGVAESTISLYESGKRQPDLAVLKRIAQELDTSVDHLLGNERKSFDNYQLVADGRGVRINVYRKIPAGAPIEAVDDIVDFEDLPIDMISGGKEYIGIKVSGDSMLPKYVDGDTVIILLQPDCESGQDCAVYVNGYDATLKKVIKQRDGILLQPLNLNYEAKFYPYTGKETVTILGVVVELRRKII